MILARLTRAIRRQNWFAVVLEFVIVVAGVLLAFQISQEGQARSERAHARDVLARVESEIRRIILVRDSIGPRIADSVDRLAEARPIITGDVAADMLTPEQCRAITRSFELDQAPDEVPSLREVIDSGALASIDNAALRHTVTEFLAKQRSVREWVRQRILATSDLTRLFPEMVWFDLIENPDNDDGWDRVAICDLEAMRASHAFRAHLMQNYTVQRSAVRFVYAFMDEALDDLHAAVDAELGLSHAGDSE